METDRHRSLSVNRTHGAKDRTRWTKAPASQKRPLPIPSTKKKEEKKKTARTLPHSSRHSNLIQCHPSHPDKHYSCTDKHSTDRTLTTDQHQHPSLSPNGRSLPDTSSNHSHGIIKKKNSVFPQPLQREWESTAATPDRPHGV